jgi:filamentous hemagglutinin
LASLVDGLPQDKKNLWLDTGSQLIGIAALGLADPQAGQSALADAGWAAKNGEEYNRGLHPQEDKKKEELVLAKAQESCPAGDSACVERMADWLGHVLQLAALGDVDAGWQAKRDDFVQQVEKAGETPETNGAGGESKAVLDALDWAEKALQSLPEYGKPIIGADGQEATGLDGKPQTYFSADEGQKDDQWLNRNDPRTFLGTPLSEESLDSWLADSIDSLNANRNAATPVCPECFLIGTDIGAGVKSLGGIWAHAFGFGEKEAGETVVAGGVVNDSKDFAKLFSQERQYWTSDPIEFNGSKVYQRDDLFDPDFVSPWTENGEITWGTNLERMATGRAPIGVDGNPVNLHHLTQNQSGALAETTESFHVKNSAIIHINPPSIPSGIDRSAFNSFRVKYWKNRAENFGR